MARVRRKKTRLEREWARIRKDYDDPSLRALTAEHTIESQDLLIWRVRPSEASIVEDGHGRTNPIIVNDLLILSVFHRPSSVVAINRQTGKAVWAIQLRTYGTGVYWPGDGHTVYASTPREVIAIDVSTGKVLWSFCPWDEYGEMIYSSPVVADGRLFVGDRFGYLWCLCTQTGDTLWWVRTSRAKNDDINSALIVVGGLVIVPTNAKRAVAYEISTGGKVWQQKLDFGCISATLPVGADVVIWTRRSVYRIRASDGEIVHRWHLHLHEAKSACPVGNLLFMVTNRFISSSKPNCPYDELRTFVGDEQVDCATYPLWAGTSLRYERLINRILEATQYGVGILNPATGQREFAINHFAQSEHAYWEDRVAQPAYADGILYVHSSKGYLSALKYPGVSVN
jgi:hypothetical protein